jgi:hypothetical protein
MLEMKPPTPPEIIGMLIITALALLAFLPLLLLISGKPAKAEPDFTQCPLCNERPVRFEF